MTIRKDSIWLLGMLAVSSATYAGSTDGLNIAVIANEATAPYVGSVRRFAADNKSYNIDCGESFLNLANVYTTNLPPQLTSDLAIGAVHDNAKRKKLGKILTGFRDPTINRGFDVVLTYEVKNGKLRFYGISADASENIAVSSISVDEANDQKKFDIVACKALATLPSLAEP